MVEGLLAWIGVFLVLFTQDPEWAKAAGLFAIAANIYRIDEILRR